MRLDKYLKVSRIIKRRTLSNLLLKMGLVSINGRLAKPATEVKEGDLLDIKMQGKLITIRVLEVKEFVRVEESSSMYEVVNERPLEDSDNF